MDNSIVMKNQRNALQGIKIENPFTVKVLQVFTGFGFGCGVGIGVGKPMNLGALPMVGQVMSATRGATDAFSGASRHVNDALRRMGAKRIELGVGCGVGFGYGFGVGLAIKPGVMQKIQLSLMDVMIKMMKKIGMAPDLSTDESIFPNSAPSGLSTSSGSLIPNPMGSITQMVPQLPDQTSQGMHGIGNMSVRPSYGNAVSPSNIVDKPFGSRTEKVLNSFLQNPILNDDNTNLNEVVGCLQSENNLLQMVLRHQKVIEELMEENEKLRRILVEELRVSPSKLELGYSTRKSSPCADCFHCRRKQRRNR